MTPEFSLFSSLVAISSLHFGQRTEIFNGGSILRVDEDSR